MNKINEAIMILREMAIEKRQLKSKLYDVSLKVIEHLVKCFIWKDTTGDLNHWCSELAAFLGTISKLKGTNKYPDKDFILGYTYEIWKEDLHVDSIVKDLLEWDGYNKLDYNKTEIENKIQKYFIWLSEQLSQKGRVSKVEIQTQINKMI